MSREPDPFTSEEHYMDNDELLCQGIELLHLLALEPEPEQEEDDTIPRLLDKLNDIDDLNGPEDEEDMARIFGATLPNYNYAPYQNKMTFWITCLICGCLRVRLRWFYEFCESVVLGMSHPSRPSEKHRRGFTRPAESKQIHTNLIWDFANPQVALYIQKYPEDVAGGPVSEIWQVENGRWHEIPLDELTPSILFGVNHFYIHEIAERWVIPALWIEYRSKIGATAVLAVEPKLTLVRLSEFSFNHEELVLRNKGPLAFARQHRFMPDFCDTYPQYFLLHDDGEDLFTVWMPFWADNVSGARSKQYQKHIHVYAANANLPAEVVTEQVEFVLHYIPMHRLTKWKDLHMSSLFSVTMPIRADPVVPVSMSLTALPTNHSKRKRPPISDIKAIIFCCFCKAGGTTEEKESPEGYHTFYEWGAPRNVEEIKSCVLEQLWLATQGVVSHVDALQTSTGTKDKIAQHWIELLIPKSRGMQAADSAPAQELFTVRLQSTNLDGLWVPPIRAAYMMQYRNSLIGKHFKTLMQTMIFHVQDIVMPDQFALVRALGQLGPVLWFPVIDNMMTYLEDLEILIDNVLDAFGTLDPSKILVKLNLHVLKHIPQNIRQRGPSVRLCSVLSNHQAPSSDIALKFTDLERVKHILSGGFWKQGSEWISAGKDARRLLVKTPVLQRHLGWAPKPEWISGLIKAHPKTSRRGSTGWKNGASITAVSGDVCKVGSWGVFRLANNVPAFGRIMTILLRIGEPSSGTEGVLVIEKFRIGKALHFNLQMSVLVEERETPHLVIPSLARHDELTITLAAQQGHKRATTKAKAAATRQKNKAKKEAREGGQQPLADHHTPNDESDEGEDPPRARKRLREE
ncbi:hypothetical protein B0H10DRAFT_1949461 [Mycena sp. CBHHK59/15]|nr:hypothetical protein B0H10DRAFT_1949461 [Mycena sp. CBHHK59/15]